MSSLKNDTGVPGSSSRGQSYWRSLDHLADTREFREWMHREFPAGASELLDTDDRRHFLKIMGASMALAGMGLAGCRRWPEEEIVAFAARPEGRDPGIPQRYATCRELGGVAAGLLVTAYDGRPTKIEGNADHPTSHGAADAFTQASVLDLYDPDRSRGVTRDGADASWTDFSAWAAGHFGGLRNSRGRGLAILAQASGSPTLQAMKRRLLAALPEARWHEYESICNDAEIEGARLAFGLPYRTQLHLGQADVIVSLDADLLGAHPNAVDHIRQFARSRAVDADDPASSTMSRLYCVESDHSLTGANADHRIAVRSSDVGVVAAALAGRILGDESLRAIEHAAVTSGRLSASAVSVIDAIEQDLNAHRTTGVVAAGARQPAEVHYLVHLINAALANAGNTVDYSPQRDAIGHVASLRALVESSVDTLVILGGNPVYDAPADLNFGAWLDGVRASVHLADLRDETSQRCTWHVNRAHYLEAWGDGRAWDGTFSLAQPLIEPLFGGRSAIELLALIVDDTMTAGRDLVRRNFDELVGGGNEAMWRQTLHDGLLPGSAFTRETRTPNRASLAKAAAALASSGPDGWEVAFAPSPSLYDGRFANNGWLQEVPDPMSKLTWDNAVVVSPRSAAELGVDDGDLVTVGVGGRTIEAPILRLPGIADRTATLHLGGGRAFEGRICAGAGFDFGTLRTSDAMGCAPATIVKARGRHPLATTQDHHTIDAETVGGRSVQSRLPTLFREADLEEYRHHPDFAAHRTHIVHRLSQWTPTGLDDAQYAWGMAVDLNACVGCGACIVACQAENNIPIVGKDQVSRGREMHWMRIDRYFEFPHSDEGYDSDTVAAVALQPVMCMHCENAPCEQVCPVAATVHDEDGLNVMVYNRCVGTRYCSNNCPYKVRRFNYFDYHRRDPHRETGLLHVEKSYFERPQATPEELLRLQFNPEVTVRMRGIMEKCTYCIQRINEVKISAKNAYASRPEAEKEALKNERVPVEDGAITPACAQTCPANALVFGDLKDPESRVSGLQRNQRAYEMLEELHVKARTKYLAKIRNPAGGASHGGADDHGSPADDGADEGHDDHARGPRSQKTAQS